MLNTYTVCALTCTGGTIPCTEDAVLLLYSLMDIYSVLTLKKRQWQDLNLRLQRRSDFESHALDHSATLSYIILLYSCLISTLKCKWWASIPRLRRDPYLKRAPWTTRPHLLLYYYTYDLDILIDIRYYTEDIFILYDYYVIFVI